MRTPSTMLVSAVVFAAFVAPGAAAAHAQPATTAQDESYIAVVTGDNVYVRSGAANSYYPFGRVNAGDLVRVTGEKFNWGRVDTTGPTFTPERFFGYIIYPATQPGRFRLNADGKTGMTLGRADVLAPNLNTGNNPNDSWKPLIRLDAGTDVKVLETTTTANNTVHKIVLPANAEAWISMGYLRRATDADIRKWEAWEKGPVVEEAAKPKAESKPAVTEKPQTTPTATQTAQATPQTPERKVEAQGEVTPAEQPRTQPSPQSTSQPAPTPVVKADEVAETVVEQTVVADADRDAKPQAAEALTEQTPVEQTVMPSLGNVEPEAPTTPTAIPVAQQEKSPEPPLAERLAEVTLEDLEQAYEQLRKDDLESAEVAPLREMYLGFADRVDGSDRTGAAFARARAEQLELLSEVQQRRIELHQIRARGRISAERAEAARLAVDAGGDYIAVGRLASSTIYDGRRLPKMLRLQDPGTGRTVAYIEPDDGYDMAGMLDQLIGVIGEKTYDGGLRLNVLKPRRIDILAPR